MLFAVSETSQLVDRISKAFLFQSSQFPEPFPIVRDLFFLHHRVMVTRSSTCTSLTSCLEEWEFCHSALGNTVFVDEAKEFLSLGDECGLLSGLIWVAMSLLETAREMSFPSSSTTSSFLSVLDLGKMSQSVMALNLLITKSTTKLTIQLRIPLDTYANILLLLLLRTMMTKVLMLEFNKSNKTPTPKFFLLQWLKKFSCLNLINQIDPKGLIYGSINNRYKHHGMLALKMHDLVYKALPL